jgi:hypothetical protein
MKKIWLGVLSLTFLGACFVSAGMYFLGRLTAGGFRMIFLAASIGWFILATLWAEARKKA